MWLLAWLTSDMNQLKTISKCMNFLSIMNSSYVVATKADKIPRGKWNKHESIIKKKLNFDKNDHFIIFHLSHVTVMMKHGILFWQNCKKSSEKSEFFLVIVSNYLFDSFHLLSKGIILC